MDCYHIFFLLFAILAFNAFVGNDLGDTHYNKIIGLMVAIYGWLFHTFGSIITGFLFVACAIGIVVAAVMDKGSKQEVDVKAFRQQWNVKIFNSWTI